MPYNANFSVTQSIDCATITITDTSSNPSSEVITDRKLYLQKADGSFIAPASQNIWHLAVAATCSFKLFSLPTLGTTGVFTVIDPVLGSINFIYTTDSSDIDLPTLSTHFAAAITADPRGYKASYNSSTLLITVTTLSSYGATANYSGSGTGIGYFDIFNFTRTNLTYFNGGAAGYSTVATGLDYYEFSKYLFPSNAITIPLAQDYALSIEMISTPATLVTGSVYSVVQDLAFTCNMQTFRLARMSDIASVPSIVNNENFKNSLYDLTLYIDNAGISISVGDVASSQSAIDAGLFLITNQNNFF